MNLTFTNDSWKEYLAWQDAFSGIGKPEPLKYELQGCWSRRITDEHRLVYEVNSYSIVIISCKYHY